MLYAFGFERVGVVVGDLYFVDPAPGPGQEGAEHGVRLELRLLERGALRGSIYSAQPIEVGQPLWRVDFLESVAGRAGSFDRTHHHPVFSGWEPNSRVFVRELSADPLGWLGGKLADLAELVASAGFPADVLDPDDADSLRAVAPEIVDATRRLLERVQAGQLGRPPRDEVLAGASAGGGAAAGAAGDVAAAPVSIRAGWL